MTVAALGGYLYLGNDKESSKESILVTTKAPDQTITPASPAQQQASSTLQVQQDNQKVQGAATSLPSPNQFDVYEQYAQDTSSSYIDIRIGSGREVVTGDTVAMFYSGFLTNGELFDQSQPDENNQIQPLPFTVGSGQVITGWEQTIVGMKAGGQRRLIIPSQFGYGPMAQGSIPPNAMLIFDVELAGIQGEQ